MKREHTSAYTAAISKADYLARLYLWYYEMRFKDALDRVKNDHGFEKTLPDRVLRDILFRAFTLGKGSVLTGNDLECLPPNDWLWEPFIPRGLVATVFGNPWVCKSGLCQYIAKRLWEGGRWPNDRDIQCKSKTLWLDAEGAKTQVRDRLRDWNMDGEALLLPNQEDIFSDFHINPESDAVVREILEEHQVAMVVVDSLTGVHEENENKAHRMRSLLDIFKRWAEDHNCAVVIVHHPNKKNQLNQSDRLDLDRMRDLQSYRQ
jgi:hypothetical protein